MQWSEACAGEGFHSNPTNSRWCFCVAYLDWFLHRLCEFVAETVRINHAINVTWDDVVRAQLSSGTLVSDHKYQQPQPRTAGKAENYQLMAGGRSMPMLCIPRHRVAVIIPFRARDQHLTSFINHLYPFLRSQLLDFIIVVVEQVCVTLGDLFIQVLAYMMHTLSQVSYGCGVIPHIRCTFQLGSCQIYFPRRPSQKVWPKV